MSNETTIFQRQRQAAKTKMWLSPNDLAHFFKCSVPEVGIMQPCVICDARGIVMGGQECSRCGGAGKLVVKAHNMTPLERDALLVKSQERM